LGIRTAPGNVDIDSSRLIIPALGFGLLAGILSIVPVLSLLNCVFCLWVVLCGGLTVYMVKRHYNIQGKIITMKAGLAGAITGGIAGIVTNIPFLISREDMVTTVQEVLNQPEFQELLEGTGSILEESMGQLIILGVILNIVFFLLFGALGGIISNEITK
jgi:hypothetical protein